MYAPEVADEVLICIVATMRAHHDASTAQWCVDWLRALSGAPRFEMTVLMLAAAAKRDAAALFDALAESGAAVGDDVRKLYR